MSHTPATKESTGESIFNYATYTGVGFGLNLALSVLITDYFTHGHGKQWLRSLSSSAARGLESSFGAKAGSLENTAYGFFKTNALMSGGHIVMAPIKWAEDHKRYMVHWINRQLGIDKPIMKDGKEKYLWSLDESELPELYQEQPKQSWMNVVARRATGLAFTTAIGTGLGEHRLEQVENTLTDKMILPAIKKTPLAPLTHSDAFCRYTRLVSLDQFFTAITSAVTYFTNGAKEEKDGEKAKTFTARVTEELQKPTPAQYL